MKRLAALGFGLTLILAWLIASVGLVALNNDFYHAFYQKTDLARHENIRAEDADLAIDLMVDYVKDLRDDMHGTIVWKNGEQEVFNERETAHMKDVKALWQHARTFGILCAAVSGICLIFLYVRSKQTMLAWLSKGYLEALACMAVVLVFFGFWMAIDFTGLWIQFHEWFFTNDLWALDPFTDFMIVICPESLFFTLIIRIALCFGVPVLVLAISALYYLRKKAVIGFERLH